jgi:biopolymer transport protein ExbB
MAIAGHVRNNRRDEAIARVGRLNGAVREMIQVGVENTDATVVFLEEVMLSVIARTRPKLERFLPFLSITVVAAPLLGLLGTVVGMIKTFALITVFGTGDPKALSSGISEALVTTEIGLVVAIVVLLLHAAFSRVIRGRLGMMERVAFDFVTFVRHGPEED